MFDAVTDLPLDYIMPSLHHEPNGKLPLAVTMTWAMLGVVVAISGFNQFLLLKFATSKPAAAASSSVAKISGDPNTDSIALAIATGVPRIYGSELSVSYDDVQRSMDIMAAYDPDYGSQKLTLSPELQQRYINIGTRISCEYCCGAKAILFNTGKAACGCAHSQAMRGLAVYLLSKHAGEYSDDQILQELARWKARYFPKQMIAKVAQQRASGQYTTDVAALLLGAPAVKASNRQASGGTAPPLPSSLQNLPNMVGGC